MMNTITYCASSKRTTTSSGLLIWNSGKSSIPETHFGIDANTLRINF